MNRTLVIVTLIVAATHPCASQIGATKEQLVERYGQCTPNPMPKPTGPNAYDTVLDVGDLCFYRQGQFRITALFKSGKAVEFQYRKLESFSYRKRPHYLELTDDEIASLLHAAVPAAEWVSASSDTPVRRWRTRNSSAFAYYFPYNHHDHYALWVHTAAIDAISRRVSPE